MVRARAAVPAVYYGLLAVLLALAVTDSLGGVFPGPVAKHLGENSEGLLLALLLPAWVQFVRPRLRGTRGAWAGTAVVSGGLLALGLLLRSVDTLPGRVETLNEPVLALAVLVGYLQLRRPLPDAAVLALPVGVLLLIAAASGTVLVTELAEGLAVLVLAPVGLDLVDRGVLQPGARSSDAVRWSWYAFLLLAPVAVAVAAAPDATGALRYAERLQEAFLGLLVAQVHLATRPRETRPGRHRSASSAEGAQPVGRAQPVLHPSE